MIYLGYNHGLSQKEVEELQRKEAIQTYLINNDLLRAKYTVKGNTLSFRFNVKGLRGYDAYERRVNLTNFSYKDVKLKIRRYTNILYDASTGRFSIL